jgi:hypothetical protein
MESLKYNFHLDIVSAFGRFKLWEVFTGLEHYWLVTIVSNQIKYHQVL